RALGSVRGVGGAPRRVLPAGIAHVRPLLTARLVAGLHPGHGLAALVAFATSGAARLAASAAAVFGHAPLPAGAATATLLGRPLALLAALVLLLLLVGPAATTAPALLLLLLALALLDQRVEVLEHVALLLGRRLAQLAVAQFLLHRAHVPRDPLQHFLLVLFLRRPVLRHQRLVLLGLRLRLLGRLLPVLLARLDLGRRVGPLLALQP